MTYGPSVAHVRPGFPFSALRPNWAAFAGSSTQLDAPAHLGTGPLPSRSATLDAPRGTVRPTKFGLFGWIGEEGG